MSTRTVSLACFAYFVIGGARLTLAQPTVPKPPKPAPVPKPIVPGAPLDPHKARIIGPGSAPEKVQIVPGIATPGIIAAPGVKPPAAKIDPESLNQKAVTNRFVMALAQDKSGALWVGTEDEGVWRYDEKAPEAKRWKQFTTKDGLGDDNAYALAVDSLGRVWAGHLNHGVSVFDGGAWHNYDALTGPLGDRVFDIDVSPRDGNVWIATDAGLTRYSDEKDEWRYFTRAEGLPSDQIAALAFNAKGDLFAGTQCEGLAIARAADDFKTWKSVRGAERMPNTPIGKGLPSNLINDVLVSKSGAVYVATTCGLARSFDDGATWDYIRGADWDAKVRGLYKGPLPVKMNFPGDLLLEDYSTCLAEDAKGQLYVGHWQKGIEARNNRAEKRLVSGGVISAGVSSANFVRAVLPFEGKVALGFYGGGVSEASENQFNISFQLPTDTTSPRFPAPVVPSIINPHMIEKIKPAMAASPIPEPIKPVKPSPVTATSPASSTVATLPVTKETATPSAGVPEFDLDNLVWLPTVAAPLSVGELQAMSAKVQSHRLPLPQNSVVFLGDDWNSKGDWVGRYGRQYAILWAVSSPWNETFPTADSNFYGVRAQIGPHHEKGDAIRHWLHWLKTENLNSLYNPEVGHRVQADVDDHGEAYPMAFEGPDLWFTVQAPVGVSRVSLYFFNKDGHEGQNGLRDYLIEVKPYREKTIEDTAQRVGLSPPSESAPLPDLVAAQSLPTLARARVRDFWGGVYKQFQVHGPAKFLIRVSRNNSFNTICSGTFIDKLKGAASPDDVSPMVSMGEVYYGPPLLRAKMESMASSETIRSAMALWEELDAVFDHDAVYKLQTAFRRLAYRAANVEEASPFLLAKLRWKLFLWTPEDRDEYASTTKRAFKAYQTTSKGDLQ